MISREPIGFGDHALRAAEENSGMTESNVADGVIKIDGIYSIMANGSEASESTKRLRWNDFKKTFSKEQVGNEELRASILTIAKKYHE